jgi:hypothetical protein
MGEGSQNGGEAVRMRGFGLSLVISWCLVELGGDVSKET